MSDIVVLLQCENIQGISEDEGITVPFHRRLTVQEHSLASSRDAFLRRTSLHRPYDVHP
jgi:hypothetical protein